MKRIDVILCVALVVSAAMNILLSSALDRHVRLLNEKTAETELLKLSNAIYQRRLVDCDPALRPLQVSLNVQR